MKQRRNVHCAVFLQKQTRKGKTRQPEPEPEHTQTQILGRTVDPSTWIYIVVPAGHGSNGVGELHQPHKRQPISLQMPVSTTWPKLVAPFSLVSLLFCGMVTRHPGTQNCTLRDCTYDTKRATSAQIVKFLEAR